MCEYERNIAEFDQKSKYNKFHHNDEHELGEFDRKFENIIFSVKFTMLTFVQRCQLFGNVHRFWSYSFGHLDLIK